MIDPTNPKIGYYVYDSGDPDDPDSVRYCYFYMGDHAPLEQYVLHDGLWVSLEYYQLSNGAWRKALNSGYYLWDRIFDGDPSYSGPFDEPPEGVPPFDPTAPKPSPRYLVFRGGGWVKLTEEEAEAERIAAGPPRRPRRVTAAGGMPYDDL